MKKLLTICTAVVIFFSCNSGNNSIDKEWHRHVKRVGMVVKIKKGKLEQYKKFHADSNPGVRDLLTKYGMHNFSIYIVQLADSAWYEFGYYEYWGNDFEGDMKKLAEEPRNKRWLELCDPLQEGILPDQQGWKQMDKLYFNY
jgi:L-rhamnose mutarotase